MRLAPKENFRCPFKYQGQYYDSEVELCYNRFRYYHPETGRYISEDPIEFLSGEPNFFAYVSDTNAWVDLLGLSYEKKLSNGKNIKDLLDSGNLPDRNGLTKVGRAQQKHSNRTASVFEKPSTGTKATDYNNKGSETLENILNDEKSLSSKKEGGFDVKDSSGKGARFDENDIFKGFLEPNKRENTSELNSDNIN